MDTRKLQDLRNLGNECEEAADEIDRLTRELAEAKARAVPPLSDVLDEYEARTKALPGQHEIPERGCSTYNWQMAVIRELRAMLSACPDPKESSNEDY